MMEIHNGIGHRYGDFDAAAAVAVSALVIT